MNLRLGGAYGFTVRGQANTVSVDASKERSGKAVAGFGVETVVAGAMPLRLGFNTRYNAGPGVSAGLGWLHKDFAFDYAIVPYGDLGLSHRASVTWKWGSDAPAAAPAAEPAKSEASASEEHFARAARLLKAGSLDAARAELQEAAGRLPDEDRRRVLYYERMGHLSYLEQDCAKAKSFFSQALRLAAGLGMHERGVADAYAGMGLCLLKERNRRLAVQYFRKALEAEPSSSTRKLAQDQLERLAPDR